MRFESGEATSASILICVLAGLPRFAFGGVGIFCSAEAEKGEDVSCGFDGVPGEVAL